MPRGVLIELEIFGSLKRFMFQGVVIFCALDTLSLCSCIASVIVSPLFFSFLILNN
jgi:hypothetical protein